MSKFKKFFLSLKLWGKIIVFALFLILVLVLGYLVRLPINGVILFFRGIIQKTKIVPEKSEATAISNENNSILQKNKNHEKVSNRLLSKIDDVLKGME